MNTLENNNRKNFDSSTEQLNFPNINSKGPVPKGFEVFLDDEKGFFIINPIDQSLFKWIDIKSLECNGVIGKRKNVQYGRRNFEGNFFESKFTNKDYHETADSDFITCVEKFGGFYISVYKARYDEERNIGYSGKGKLVDCVIASEAKKSARKYMMKEHVSRDYTTDLPCGAAMDCFFEYVYEQFEKEVLSIREKGERKYDAWNRYEKTMRFKEEGIYGIHDLISDGAELTTEAYSSAKYHIAVRAGARGLFLISYHDYEQERFEHGERNIYFELGHRNFISTEVRFYDYGYRLMLLPV